MKYRSSYNRIMSGVEFDLKILSFVGTQTLNIAKACTHTRYNGITTLRELNDTSNRCIFRVYETFIRPPSYYVHTGFKFELFILTCLISCFVHFSFYIWFWLCLKLDFLEFVKFWVSLRFWNILLA